MDEHLERCIDYMYMIASNDGASYPHARVAAYQALRVLRQDNERDRAYPHDLDMYRALTPLVTLLLRRKDNGESGWK